VRGCKHHACNRGGDDQQRGRREDRERDGVAFNLANIGPDFTVVYNKPFEQSYMRPLFEYGRQRALRGDAWVTRLPV
jgi:hypothetical protein